MFLFPINYYVSIRTEKMCRVNTEIKKMQCSHVVTEVFKTVFDRTESCFGMHSAMSVCELQALSAYMLWFVSSHSLLVFPAAWALSTNVSPPSSECQYVKIEGKLKISNLFLKNKILFIMNIIITDKANSYINIILLFSRQED